MVKEAATELVSVILIYERFCRLFLQRFYFVVLCLSIICHLKSVDVCMSSFVSCECFVQIIL